MEIEQIEAVGPEQVIALMHVTVSGRASGVPTDSTQTNIYDLSGGAIKRVRVFRDRQEALEAVGRQQ